MDVRTSPEAAARARPALIVTLGSAFLAVMKGAAAALTGSSALLASAVDSAADTLVSAGNWFAVRAAGRPADRGHPFGHGKLEHLAGLFQALLIGGGSVVVVVEAFRRFGRAEPLTEPGIGIATAVISLVGAWTFTRYLRMAARRSDSPALAADSGHYAADFVGHIGVVCVFVVHGFTDSPYVDAVAAVIIAGLVGNTAWEILRDAVQSLMDSELDDDEVSAIEEAIRSIGPPVRGWHDLLTRRSGPDRFVQVHVEIDASLGFREAHEIVERIERTIQDRVPRAEVIIHADPWPETPGDPHLPHAPSGRT